MVNANQILSTLPHNEAMEIIKSTTGYSGPTGSGEVQSIFENNPTANQNALQMLSSRGYYNPTLVEHQQFQVQNPQLPVNAEFVPETQKVNNNELMSSISVPEAEMVKPTLAEASNAKAPDPVDIAQEVADLKTVDASYQAETVSGQTPQAQAQEGQVSELSTMVGQLNLLYSQIGEDNPPPWVNQQLTMANEMMNARGIKNSTLGVTAVIQAVSQQALSIAESDSAKYFQMDMQNLSNKQQTELFNVQTRHQSLLSDQAAINAQKQFNAASTTQLQQFTASLVSDIKKYNASLKANIETVNAQLKTDVSKANSALIASIEQSNADRKFQRDTFEANMRFAIDQSNTQWRRSVNTSNTAAINAANQANTQNLFNLSTMAQNNLWQAFRDEAHWLWQSAENEATRANNLLMAADTRAFQSGLIDDSREFEVYQAVGSAIWDNIISG